MFRMLSMMNSNDSRELAGELHTSYELEKEHQNNIKNYLVKLMDVRIRKVTDRTQPRTPDTPGDYSSSEEKEQLETRIRGVKDFLQAMGPGDVYRILKTLAKVASEYQDQIEPALTKGSTS